MPNFVQVTGALMDADIDAIADLYNFAKKEIQYKNYFINI